MDNNFRGVISPRYFVCSGYCDPQRRRYHRRRHKFCPQAKFQNRNRHRPIFIIVWYEFGVVQSQNNWDPEFESPRKNQFSVFLIKKVNFLTKIDTIYLIFVLISYE